MIDLVAIDLHASLATALTHLADQSSVEDPPGVFGQIAPFIEDYGYLGIVVFVFIENLGIPFFPGEAALILGGIYTVTGTLNLVPLLIIAWVTAVLGDNAGFAVGRYGGRPLALKLGRRFGVTHALLDRVEAFYERHGSWVVAAGRFLPILRHLNGLVAGLTKITWPRFLAANMIGAAIWVGVWVEVGIHAGNHLEAVDSFIQRFSRLLIVLLFVIIVVVVVRFRVHRRAAMAEEAAEEAASAQAEEEALAAAAEQPVDIATDLPVDVAAEPVLEAVVEQAAGEQAPTDPPADQAPHEGDER
ncbi:DedA family protein [Nocardioides sp.]|uniref:DedA family protein n=1 Tax=Nocardioides sp. TaxID=35761 RepID=UPI0037848B68